MTGLLFRLASCGPGAAGDVVKRMPWRGLRGMRAGRQAWLRLKRVTEVRKAAQDSEGREEVTETARRVFADAGGLRSLGEALGLAR